MTLRRSAWLPALLALTLPGTAWGQSACVSPGCGTPNFDTLQLNSGPTASGFGTAIGNILPPLINSGGSGHPGINLSDVLILQRAARGATDFADLQFNRTTAFSGGGGQINAMLRVTTSAGTNDASGNWNFVGNCKSVATGGSCIGGYLLGTRNIGGGTNIWGAVLNGEDATDLASTSGGSVIGVEVDVSGNLADNGFNAAMLSSTGIRKGIAVAAVRDKASDTSAYEVSSGLWFESATNPPAGTDSHTYFDQAIGFAVNQQARIALDTRGMIAPVGSTDPVFAVTMTAGHCVDFNGSASLVSNPGGNYMCYDSATSKWKYYVAGVAKWSVDASGNARFAGTVTPSVTP